MNLTKRQLAPILEHWRHKLRIDPLYTINVEIHRSPKSMPKGHEDSQACIAVAPGYYIADLDVNKQLIEPKELDGVILHELLHIVLAPIQEHLDGKHDYLIEGAIERLLPGLLEGRE